MSKLDIKLVEKMYSDYGQELTPERLEYIKDEFSNNNDFNKSFLNKYDPGKAVSEAEVEKKNLDTTTTLDVAQSDSQEPPKKKSTLSVGGKPVQTGASVSSAGASSSVFGDTVSTFQESLVSDKNAKDKEKPKKKIVSTKKKEGELPFLKDIDRSSLKMELDGSVKKDLSGNVISIPKSKDAQEIVGDIQKRNADIQLIKQTGINEDIKKKQEQGIAPPTSELIKAGAVDLELSTGDGGVSDFLRAKSFEEQIAQQSKNPIEKAKESSKSFKINYDNFIKSRDLDLENPYAYYSKIKDGDSEIKELYGDNPIVNEVDFDGFLRKNGYLYDFKEEAKSGFYTKDSAASNSEYNEELLKEKKLVDYFKLYLEDRVQRDFDKNSALYLKKNPNATIEEIEKNVEKKSIDQNLFDSYIQGNFPAYYKATSEKKKKEAQEYKEYKENKGEFFSWQTGRNILKGLDNTIFKRVNEVSSTVYDLIGFEGISKKLRYKAEEAAFLNPQDRNVSYVSGKKVSFGGNEYLVDSQGNIYDYEIKKRVTDLFDKDAYDSLIDQSKKGKDDYMFSWSGSTIQTTNVVADLGLQVLVTRGFSGASSLMGRGLTKEGLSMLKNIPLSKEMAASGAAQTFMGYSDGLESTLSAAKNAGIPDKEAKELANDAAMKMAGLYLLTSGISPQTKATFNSIKNKTISESIEAYAKNGRKGYLAAMDKGMSRLMEFGKEGGKETAQEIIQQGSTIYGVNRSINEKAGKEIVQEEMTGDELISMIPSTFVAGGIPVMIRMGSNIFSKKDYLSNLDTASNNVDLSNKRLGELLQANAITQDEYNKSKEDLRVYSQNKNKIPKDTSSEIVLDVARGLDEISKLESQKQSLDKAFHPDIDKKIEAKRNEVKQLYSDQKTQEENEQTKLKIEAASILKKEALDSGIKEEDINISSDLINKKAKELYNQKTQQTNEEVTGQTNAEKKPTGVNAEQTTSAAQQENVVQLQEEVSKLRSEEVKELKDNVENPDNFITDGKVDPKKVSESDNAKAKEIYAKYDKLLKPLLDNIKTQEVEVVTEEATDYKVISQKVLDKKELNTVRASLRASSPYSFVLEVLDAVAKGEVLGYDSELDSTIESMIENGVSINNVANLILQDDVITEKKGINSKRKAIDYALNIGAKGTILKTGQQALLDNIKTQEDAIQEQSTDEGLLQPEQSKMGLQEVEQGNAKQEVVAEQSKEKINTKISDPYTSSEVDRVKTLPAESEDGATMNLDGSKYEGGGLVIPLASKNMDAPELTSQAIQDFIDENSESVGADNVKVGIYKFPNSNQVSIDINIVSDRSMREEALAIGKELGQESLFDLDTFENIKTGADGKNPKKLTPSEFRAIQERLKPKKVLLPTKVAEKLTENENGDYVFKHYSDQKRDVIKKGQGQNKITSREESSALSSVGGLAMFYTMDGQKETGVGNVENTITVPKNKVYDIDSDPLGFESEAKKRFNEARPGQAFTNNYRGAFITQIANENGFDIAVSQWRGSELRAQTTKELPVSNDQTSFKERPLPTFNVGDKAIIDGKESVIEKVDGDKLTYKSLDGTTSGVTLNNERNRRSITKIDGDALTSDETTNTQNTENKIEGSDFITISPSDKNIDDKISKSSNKKIANLAVKAVKAVSKVLPGIKVVLHNTNQSFVNVSGESKNQSSNGLYINGEIHINLENANKRTVAHEIFHAILLSKVKTNAKASEFTRKMINAILPTLDKNPALKKRLQDFADNYEESIQNEEKLAELFGIMAENYSTFSGRAKEIIKNWINGLAKMFGIEAFQSNETLDILNAISKKVATGTTIEGVDLKLFDEVTDVAEDWGISLDRQQKRTKPDPVKTVKAYKLFRVSEKNPGKIFPLFVDANTPVEIGSWIDADMAEGYSFQGLNGHFYIPSTEYEVVNQRTGKVEKRKTGQGVEIPNEKVREELIARGFLPKDSKSKSVTSLARRPGWHSGDLPMSTHLGSKSQGSSIVDIRSNDQVWAEVEMAADVDWQKIANDAARTTASGGKDLKTAHITDRVPEDGFYKYKTNPNMTGSWIIGGSMKVNRILSDEEVAEINKEAGVEDLPREKPFDAARFGINELINVSPDTKKVDSPVELISRKQVGGFDVKYTEQEKIDKLTKDGLITEPEDTSFMNNEQVAITSPDDMLVGTISIDGKEIFEGGGGVFFVTKYGDVWASGKEGTANTLATAINNSLKNNKSGKGYLVLTKGSDSKLISSSSGVNSSLAVLESMLDKNLISLSDFRSAVSSSIKTFGGEISLRASAKQMKEDINTYFSNPKESTFQRRGDVLNKIIASIAQSKSTKDNKDKIIEFLGGDKTKGIVTKVTTENKSRNQSLSDLIAGVASEKLTKGLSVGDVYAIIEVNGEVVVKEDSHPSYPFHVVQKDGKKPILHLPKLRENGSKTITTSSGKPYSVGNVSIMSGKFNDNVTRLQKRSTELADVKKEVQEVFSSAKEAFKIEKDRNKVINDLKDKVNAFVKVAIQDLKAGDIGKRAITSIASKVQDVTDQNFEEKLGEVNDILDNLYTNRDVNKAKSDKKKAFKNVMSGKVGKLADRGDRAKVMASKIVNFALLDPSTLKKVLNDSDFGLYTDYISNLAERKDALSDTDLKSYNDLYDSIAAPYKKHTDKVNEIQGKIDANQGLSESEKSFVDKNKSDFYEKEDVAEKEEADENRRAKKAAEVLKKKNQIKSFIPFMKDVFEQSIAEKGSLEWKILSTLVSLDESDVDAMPDTMLSNAINAMTSMVENDVIPTYAENLYRYTIESKSEKLFLETVAKAGKGGLYSTKAGRATLKVREALGNPYTFIRGLWYGTAKEDLLEKRIKMFRLSAIDAALKIYGDTPIFDGIMSVLGKGMSNLASTEAKAEEALLNAKRLVDKKSKNPQESYMKITYHLIDMMAKNNQGTTSDVDAIEYFEKTISDPESKIRENKRALKVVEDFVNKVKSNNNVVELTPEEAAAANAIRIVLDENQFDAYEALVFQLANSGPMVTEYFPVLNNLKNQIETDLANMQSRFGIGGTVSTKSGNLEEKSGKAHPIDMNPFTAAFSSIKNTAVQFNLRSEYLGISNGLKKATSNAISNKDKESEMFLNGIQKALDAEFDLIINGTSFAPDTLGDSIFNAIDRTFYQVMLGSVISRSVDFTGNLIQLASLNPKLLTSGNKIVKDIKGIKEAGESESELLRKFYRNAEASDINKMISAKSSNTERTEFLNKGINKTVLTKGLPLSNIFTRAKAKAIDPIDEKLSGINEGLISISDVKPYGIAWNSIFRDTFLSETGEEVRVEKIARGDKKYLKDNKDAITKASNKANRESADLFGSTNPFEKQIGIMEVTAGKKNSRNPLSALVNRARYFLGGFTIGANTSMSTAINTFIENRDPREARKALGGAIRIGMYTQAVSAVSGLVWSLFKGDDDDEDKLVESFDRLVEDDKFIKKMNNLFLDFPIQKDRDGNQVELSIEDFKKYNELRDELLSNKDFKNAYDTYYKYINRDLFDNAVRLKADELNSSKEKLFKSDITMFFDEIKKGFPKKDDEIIRAFAIMHSNEGSKLFTREEVDGYILDLENHMSKIGFLDKRALRSANSQIDRMIVNETALLLSDHRNSSASDIIVEEGAKLLMGLMFPRSNNIVKGGYNYLAEGANKMIIQSRRGDRGYDLYKDMIFQPIIKSGLSDKSQGIVKEAIQVLNPALKDLLKKDNADASTVSMLRYIKTIGTLGLNDFNKINSKMKNDEIYQKTNGKFKENIIKDIAKNKVDIIREVTDKEGIESDAKERGAYKSRVLPGIDSTEVKSKLPSYMNKKDLKINGRSIE